ncbi:hypothetical protein ABFV99_13490 [Cytobacillus horneckiae]|uniref:hypothetical protein n=1 Tax=Cytobacillus horneckiae TaxID=549687 RepID=UPI0034CF6A20
MTKEQIKESPLYVVEEEAEEEETITIDFDNQTAYQKEEHLFFDKSGATNITVGTLDASKFQLEPPKPTFKDEMNDLLINTITSKAIGSLMKKRFELDTQLDVLLSNQRMGELGPIFSNEINSLLDSRRRELNKCFFGSEVRYENIPEWAKSYIKDYTTEMVRNLSVLIDD